jgi:hypothetical protein
MKRTHHPQISQPKFGIIDAATQLRHASRRPIRSAAEAHVESSQLQGAGAAHPNTKKQNPELLPNKTKP